MVGYGTDRFPGFYLTDSGHAWTGASRRPDEVAAIMRARTALGIAAALVVANPLPESDALDPDLHDRVLRGGLAAAGQVGVSGKDVTPFLLDYFHRETAGASLEANVAIILGNAALAARIAVSHARLGAGAPDPRLTVPVPAADASAVPRRRTVVCLGDVMTDVVAQLSGPLVHGSDSPAPVVLTAGGSAANTAAWLACDGHAHGARRSRRGRTWRATQRSPRSRARRGQVRLARDPDRPTGTCIVLVSPEGERTMVPDAGANAGLVRERRTGRVARPVDAPAPERLRPAERRVAGRGPARVGARAGGRCHREPRRRVGRPDQRGRAPGRSSSGPPERTPCWPMPTRRWPSPGAPTRRLLPGP